MRVDSMNMKTNTVTTNCAEAQLKAAKAKGLVQ